MAEPDERLDGFLARAGRDEDSRHPLRGDASARAYTRLERPDGATVILMDAGPDSTDEIACFVRIARHLRQRGLSAPAILAEDPDAGLLLVEDLGTAMVDRLAARDPWSALEPYLAAAEALALLQPPPWPDALEAPDAATLADRTRPAYEWYRAGLCGVTGTDRSEDVTGELAEALDRYAGGARALCLRDFHAGNLVWKPDRSGVARLGLLDFQDAFLGHPAYDLASLLRDVRLDVPPDTASRVTRRFADLSGADLAALEAASAILAVQRNLRILGVFARLALRDGKTGYLVHLPRVWRLLTEDLAHPALGRLRELIVADMPAPDAIAAAVP